MMNVYTVQAGDTLESIARIFLVSVTDLQKWNNGKFPSLYSTTLPMTPGWVINVSPPSRTTYNVTDFGAIGHDITRNDGSVVAGSTSFVSKDGTFKSGDIGTNITVDYAATNTTLSDMLIQGASYSLLTVNPLTTEIASGANVVVQFGTNTQTFVAAATAPVGAIYVTVTAQVANYSYPIGSYVDPANLTTTITSVSSPTLITIGADAMITAFGLSYTYTPDDTAAIQAAISYCGSNGGGIVSISAGVFLCGPLTIPSYVTIEGVYRAWSTAGFGPSEFQMVQNMTAPLFTVVGNMISIRGICINGPLASSSTYPAITSGDTNGLTVRDVFISEGTGGIALNGTQRSHWENITLSGYAGDYGFSAINAGQLFISNMGSSPLSTNTLALSSFYFDGCETINAMGISTTGIAQYGIYLLSTNDSEFYDVEPNGASVSQVYLDTCGDIIIIRSLIGQPSPVGIEISNCSNVQIIGGIIADSSDNSVLIEAGAYASVFVSVNGVYIAPATNNTNDTIVIKDSCANIAIVNNLLNSDGSPTTAINDGSSDSTRAGLISNNLLVGYTPSTAIVVATQSGGVKVANNPGYQPGPQSAPSVPASGTALTNPFPFDATVYVSGGVVTAIDVGGTATGLTSGSVFVPAGETITLTYSAAPTWVWIGN
jgi:hypothetical protein